MRRATKRLTKRLVDATAPAGKEQILWDAEVPGFGLRIYPSGRRVFFLQYRPHGSRSARRLTIGVFGVHTVETARAEAKRASVRVAAGGDPADEKQMTSAELTVAELVEKFLAEHVRPRLRPKSVRDYQYAFYKHVLPVLGRKRISSVTPLDVAEIQKASADAPIAANRALKYLSSAFSFAERPDVALLPPKSNPVASVRMHKENRRVRSLKEEELLALFRALEQENAAGANPGAVTALRLSLVLGWRISECAGLRWEDVDTEQSRAVLRDAKTGTRTAPLSPIALEILASAPRLGEVVAPGRVPARAIDYKAMHRVWNRACARAGVENAQIHDCRRSIATRLANDNASVPVLQAVLGHATPHMAMRYVADARFAAAAAIDAYSEHFVRRHLEEPGSHG